MWHFREDGITKNGLYHLGDFISPKQYYNYAAIWNGEFREPKKGEWYLSGAIPTAYRAIKDYNEKFHIAKIVKVEKHEYYTIEESVNVNNWWDSMTYLQRGQVLISILGKPLSWQKSNYEVNCIKYFSELTEYARKKITEYYESNI